MSPTAATVTDPLNLPTEIAKLPWYRELLDERRAIDESRRPLVDQREALQEEARTRRRSGIGPTQDERTHFQELTQALRSNDAQQRTNTSRLRRALIEHYDEVDGLLTKKRDEATAEARAVAAEINERLLGAVDAYNEALAGQRLLRAQLIQMASGRTAPQLTDTLYQALVPSDAPQQGLPEVPPAVASPTDLLARTTT